jgi:type II secretory pathway pseudopilin PulG
MTLSIFLVLVLGLLAGGALGWIVVARHYRTRDQERQRYEAELSQVQDLYAAWALLRRMQAPDCPGCRSSES